MTNLFKKIAILGTILAAVIGGVWYATSSQAAGCSNINIVSCGTHTHSELINAYQSTEIRQIYNHFGITDSMIQGEGLHAGIADASDNTITVNGRVVARDVKTIQRYHWNKTQPIEHYGIAGVAYPAYRISNSFMPAGSKKEAFVWLDKDGKFIKAIIKNCGNPLWGEATPPPTPPKKPVLTCNSLTDKQISRNQFTFTAEAGTQDGATISKYTFDLGDGKTQTTTNKQVTYTYAKPGTYTVKLTIHGKEDKDVTRTSQNCEIKITVAEEPPITVCDKDTKKIVSKKKSEIDANSNKYSYDLNDCKIKVCDKDSGTIVTINSEDERDPKKHTDKLDDCDDIKVCDTDSKRVVTIKKSQLDNKKYVDENSEICNPKPVKPVVPELPRTGIVDTAMSVLGLGSLTIASFAYVASRRQ